MNKIKNDFKNGVRMGQNMQDHLNILHNNHHVINVQEHPFKIIAKCEEAYYIL